jgi:uncharacterized protein (TIGR02646 family)
MIRIQKGRAPAFFMGEEMRGAVAALDRWQRAQISTRRQSRAPIRFPDLQGLKAALLNESHGKCVYCEQKLTASRPVQVDHYRPASGALDVRGERSDEHYLWRAYDWENLYACCPECNQAKGSKFPVASDRVPPGTGGDLDAIEHPLILNPGRRNPEDHLQFRDDGLVAPKSMFGEYTIEILRLNRAGLVKARSAHVMKLYLSRNLVEDCHDDAEFAGLSRQIVEAYPERFSRDARLSRLRAEPDMPGEGEPAFAQEPNTDDNALSQEEKDKRRYYASYPLISSIEVHGLCGLPTLELSIAPTDTGRPACLALLDENGVGKSSILKCLTLALYDRQSIDKLDIDVASMLNPGADEGYVRVKFDTQLVSEVRITRDGIDFPAADPVPILLLAYGPTRLLPTKQHKPVPESEMSRARNLFDPYVPLRDPTDWLKSLDESHFDFAAATIKALLQLPGDAQLHRTSDRRSPISFEMYGRDQPLEQLSHGYKCVLALVCDVMATLFTRWQSIDAAQGIVLIDELESHLHPSWKLRIVSALRTAFPRVQFIVTTHDPLCLRGFDAGEVALLRRVDGVEDIAVDQQSLPAASDMRIDQILTSAYFGLGTTVDPAVEKLFSDYGSLLARQSVLNEEEREQLARLKAQVAKHDMPGLLPRDRVMYAVIDEYLATHRKEVPDDRQEFDGDLRALVDRIVNGSPDAHGDSQ